MTKKIIGVIAIAIVVIAVGLFVGLNWQNLKAVFSGSKIYTAEQIEDNYNKGYADANVNENAYLEKLDYYKQIEDVYMKLIETNSQLQFEYNKLESDNQQSNENIATLRNEIVDLENEITRLTGLVNDYLDEIGEVYEVDFYNGEILCAVKVVEKSKSVTNVPSPEKDGYNFLGWSIDGQDIVDLDTYSIEEKTTFVAVYEFVGFEVTFKNGNNVVSTLMVDNGGFVTSIPTITDDRFVGWTLDGQNIVENISSKAVTSSITYTAKFGTWTTLSSEYGLSIFDSVYTSKNNETSIFNHTFRADSHLFTDTDKVKVNFGTLCFTIDNSDGSNTLYYDNDNNELVDNSFGGYSLSITNTDKVSFVVVYNDLEVSFDLSLSIEDNNLIFNFSITYSSQYEILISQTTYNFSTFIDSVMILV